jgi:hypothetical protein
VSIFASSLPLKVFFDVGKQIPIRLHKLYLLPSYSEMLLDSKEKLASLWDFEGEKHSLSDK